MATPQMSSEERGIAACSIFERYHPSLSQSMTSPYTVVKICQILYSKRCVDESVLDEVESVEDKMIALMGAIEKAVSDDHRKLYELAIVLYQIDETASVAEMIIRDYKEEILKKAASEALTKNIVNLNRALSGSAFQEIILACEQRDLIILSFKKTLLDTSTTKSIENKAAELVSEMQNNVSFQPDCLDAFLCVLTEHGGIPGITVAETIAKDYCHMLPNYERLFSSATGYNDLMSIEDKAIDVLRTHYSTLSQSLKDPVNIARLLHEENVISEEAVIQVDSAAIKDKTTVLLLSVRRAIHDNHQHLNEFGRVLQQLTTGNERVGQDILNDYNEAFPIENVFSKSQDEYTTMVQSSSRNITGGTSVNVRIDPEMINEFTKIKGMFGLTFHKIKTTLIKYSVPVDDVKSFCKFTYPKCSQEINDCQTMEDVLIFVNKKCTLINVSILEKLLEVSEPAKEAKQHIQDYQQAIDDFSQKMRARFPLNQSLLSDGTPHPLRGETITFVIDRDPETISLEDIKDLQTYAFGKHAKHVKVIVIKETNSIMITCSFSFELTGLLMAEAMKNLKLLKKNGLLKLTIGYCTIWNIRDEEEKEETTDVLSKSEKVITSKREREMELEQSLQETDKLNEIISYKDKEVKELQDRVNLLTKELNFFKTEKEGNDISDELMEEEMNEDITSDIPQQIKYDDVTSHDVISSRNKRKLSQAETESTDDDVKPSKLLKLSNESKLVGQTDETIEELQQPLQGKEDQLFPSHTITPPSLSDTPSDEENLMLKQKIRAMSMENETLKTELMKSKQESTESCQRNKVVSTPPISSSGISTTHHHGAVKELWYQITKKPDSGAQPNVTPQLMNISSKILKEFSDEIVFNLSNDQNLCSLLIKSLEANTIISTTEKEQALKISNSVIRSKYVIYALNTLVQRATNPPKLFGRILLIFDQFRRLKYLSEKMKEKAIQNDAVSITNQKITHALHQDNIVSQAIAKYSYKLSTVYKKIEPDNKWSPINALSYVNLVISKHSANSHAYVVSVDDVDTMVMKKQLISINEDLCQIPQGSWVLIQGSPGIGKSMLAHEMCKSWMNGTDLQHYSLVLLLQLNDGAVHSKLKPEALDDLICHYIDDEPWRSDVIEELKSIEGDGILLMLDGYDDLPKDILPHTDKMLNELKSKFHKASIFITTRSSAPHFPADTNIQKFEVLGFDELSIDQYSDAFFSKNPTINQRDLFKSYIYKLPILSKCLHIPLHLAITLYIFHVHGQLTMTEFFEKLVCLLIYRFIKSQPSNNDDDDVISLQLLNSLNDLPLHVENDFNTLCRLAYNGINQDSSMFDDSSDDIVTLGLMNKVNKADGIFTYSFSYPAIQEFLGAYHIYKYLPNEVNKYFSNAAQPHILRFLAGLTKLKEVDIRSHIFNKTVTNLALFHGLLESKNVTGWLEEGRVIVARIWPANNVQPHDMYALGQCVSLSHCTWEFGFTFRSLTHKHVKMFVEGINSNDIVSFMIESIKLALNPIGSEGVIELFKLPGFIFKSMSQLFLRCVSADSECLKSSSSVLVKVAHLHSLKEFLFHDNNFKEGEQKLLIQVLVKLPLLCHVSFSQLSSDECSLLLRGSSSIATIELYNILSSTIKSVISCLPYAESLQHLQIHQSEVTLADIQDLPSILPSSSIKSLHFNNCAITSDTARSILTAVAASPTVETLSLDDNIIDDECGEYIAMNMESIANKHLLAPSTNKLPFKLKELSLVRNPFTEKSIKLLMDKRTSILNIKTTDLK